MDEMRIGVYHLDKSEWLCLSIEDRAGFLGRLRGLMFRESLAEGHGLLLRNVPSIHMMFMRFPIDAIFLDAEGVVTDLFQNLRPWFGLASSRAGRDVLEVRAGTVKRTGIQAGDRIELRPVENPVMVKKDPDNSR